MEPKRTVLTRHQMEPKTEDRAEAMTKSTAITSSPEPTMPETGKRPHSPYTSWCSILAQQSMPWVPGKNWAPSFSPDGVRQRHSQPLCPARSELLLSKQV
jgi:hypothetical protein